MTKEEQAQMTKEKRLENEAKIILEAIDLMVKGDGDNIVSNMSKITSDYAKSLSRMNFLKTGTNLGILTDFSEDVKKESKETLPRLKKFVDTTPNKDYTPTYRSKLAGTLTVFEGLSPVQKYAVIRKVIERDAVVIGIRPKTVSKRATEKGGPQSDILKSIEMAFKQVLEDGSLQLNSAIQSESYEYAIEFWKSNLKSLLDRGIIIEKKNGYAFTNYEQREKILDLVFMAYNNYKESHYKTVKETPTKQVKNVEPTEEEILKTISLSASQDVNFETYEKSSRWNSKMNVLKTIAQNIRNNKPIKYSELLAIYPTEEDFEKDRIYFDPKFNLGYLHSHGMLIKRTAENLQRFLTEVEAYPDTLTSILDLASSEEDFDEYSEFLTPEELEEVKRIYLLAVQKEEENLTQKTKPVEEEKTKSSQVTDEQVLQEISLYATDPKYDASDLLKYCQEFPLEGRRAYLWSIAQQMHHGEEVNWMELTNHYAQLEDLEKDVANLAPDFQEMLRNNFSVVSEFDQLLKVLVETKSDLKKDIGSLPDQMQTIDKYRGVIPTETLDVAKSLYDTIIENRKVVEQESREKTALKSETEIGETVAEQDTNDSTKKKSSDSTETLVSLPMTEIKEVLKSFRSEVCATYKSKTEFLNANPEWKQKLEAIKNTDSPLALAAITAEIDFAYRCTNDSNKAVGENFPSLEGQLTDILKPFNTDYLATKKQNTQLFGANKTLQTQLTRVESKANSAEQLTQAQAVDIRQKDEQITTLEAKEKELSGSLEKADQLLEQQDQKLQSLQQQVDSLKALEPLKEYATPENVKKLLAMIGVMGMPKISDPTISEETKGKKR